MKTKQQLDLIPVLELPHEFGNTHAVHIQQAKSILEDFFGKEIEDLSTKEKMNYICDQLPYASGSIAKGSPGSPSFLSIKLLVKPIPFFHIVPSFSDIVADRIVVGKSLPILELHGMEFCFKEAKNTSIAVLQVIIEIQEEQDLLEAEKNLPFLIEELKHMAVSKRWTDYLLQTRGTPLDGHILQVHRYLITLLNKHENISEDIIFELQRFLGIVEKNFRFLRLPQQIVRLICYMYFLPRILQEHFQAHNQKNHLLLRLIPMKVHFPYGIRKTLGMFFCVNLRNEYESINDSQILKAVLSLHDNVQIVEQSLFRYHNKQDNLEMIYLEVQKINTTPFSFDEIVNLKKHLPKALLAHIQTHAQFLYNPLKENNQEKKRSQLIAQIQSKTDLPQVRIDFLSQTSDSLVFELTVAKYNLPADLLIEDLKSSLFEITFKDSISQKDSSGDKSAGSFELTLSKTPFFRSNHAVDLLAARTAIVSELSKLLGPIRDTNGGMIAKQQEKLLQLKKNLKNFVFADLFSLENFFYNFTPAGMQVMLDTKILKELFLLFQQAQEESLDDQVYSKFIQGHNLTVFTSSNTLCKEHLDRSIEQLMTESIASTYVLKDGLIYIGYLFASKDPTKLRSFSNNLQRSFEDWITSQKERQKLTLRLNHGLPSLDPREGGDEHNGFLMRMLYDGLTRFDKNGKLVNALADTIETSEDCTTYTFTLKDASWSNGDPITAYDFEYAWKRIIDPEFYTLFAHVFFVIKNAKRISEKKLPIHHLGVVAINDKTLRVDLEHSCPFFLDICAHWTYFPIHKKSDETNPGWAYMNADTHVGCGPFVLEYHDERRTFLKKNSSYWDHEAVRLQDIEIIIKEDHSKDLAMLQKGELDYIGQPLSILPLKQARALQKKGELLTFPVNAVTRIELNIDRFPFNNINFRKALAYTLDRELLATCTTGPSHPTTSMLPSEVSIHDDPLFKDGDIEGGIACFEKALEELGMEKELLPPITIFCGTSSVWDLCVEQITKSWKEHLGLEVSVKKLSWDDLLEQTTKGNFQVSLISWYCWFSDPIYVFDIFKSRSNPLNTSNWTDPEFVEQLDLAEKSADPKLRKEAFKKAEKIMIDHMPVIPILRDVDTYMKNPNLHGIYNSSLGDIDFKEAYFE